MKNKKGFTIMELIVIIGILALLLIISVPAIMNARNNAIGGLNKEQENNIKEAGKLLGIDLDDYNTEIYECKSGSWITTSGSDVKCTKDAGSWVEVHLKVSKLVEKGYFSDEGNHCSGGLTVTKTNSGYRVTFDADLKCTGGY